MSGHIWISNQLFLGRTRIGRVSGNWKTPGPNGEQWAALSYLPGAASFLGTFADKATARAMVERSADSRCKALFGAPISTTAAAVEEGRTLRRVARAIWRAGVWRCDRPVNGAAMFADLGRALGMSEADAPRPNRDAPPGGYDDPGPAPDEIELIE